MPPGAIHSKVTSTPELLPAASTQSPGTFAEGLAFSRDLSSKALVAKGSIAMRDHGYTVEFQYQRLNNLERLQTGDMNFVRATGGSWVKSNNWSAAGPAASPADNILLGDLIAMMQSPWQAATSADAVQNLAQSNTADDEIVYAKTNGTPLTKCLFSFRRWGPRLQLHRFSGPVGQGSDQLQLTLDFTYPLLPPPSATASITAPGRAEPKSRPH